jgi:hypothetical protein
MSRMLEIRLRRSTGFIGIASLLLLDIYATGFFGGSERTLAVVRSVVLPGLPFLEWNIGFGLATIAIALAAVTAWLRWGADWIPVLVIVLAMAVAAFVMPLHHGDDSPAQQHGQGSHHAATGSNALPADPGQGQVDRILASHEFTIVLVVFAFFARLRLLLGRVPGLSAWMTRLWPAAAFDAVSETRATAFFGLAGHDDAAWWQQRHPALLQRAVRINRIARLRFSGDPLTGAHAALRAALCLSGRFGERETRALQAESDQAIAGVPDSEPTWLRPLDTLLCALALHKAGDSEALARWQQSFERHFPLHRGRRPAALHRPTLLAIGALTDWEHALVTALARSCGVRNGADWPCLRDRCLGAAARGDDDEQALRFIAAGRWWARLEKDTEAESVLARRSLRGDRLTEAVVTLAGFSTHEINIAN